MLLLLCFFLDWFVFFFERRPTNQKRNDAPPHMNTRNAQNKTKAQQRTALQLQTRQLKAHVAKLLKNYHATCVHACGIVVLLLVQDSHAGWLTLRFRKDARTGKWLAAKCFAKHKIQASCHNSKNEHNHRYTRMLGRWEGVFDIHHTSGDFSSQRRRAQHLVGGRSSADSSRRKRRL